MRWRAGEPDNSWQLSFRAPENNFVSYITYTHTHAHTHTHTHKHTHTFTPAPKIA